MDVNVVSALSLVGAVIASKSTASGDIKLDDAGRAYNLHDASGPVGVSPPGPLTI